MTNVDVPEYIQVYLVRIYSTHLLENKEILLNSFYALIEPKFRRYYTSSRLNSFIKIRRERA